MKTGRELRKEILDEVEKCVCLDRDASYGDAADNFEHIRELWGWWLHRRGLVKDPDELTKLDVAQMSAMIKIARKVNNLTLLDNWVDDAGYSACGGGLILGESQKTVSEDSKPPSNPPSEATFLSAEMTDYTHTIDHVSRPDADGDEDDDDRFPDPEAAIQNLEKQNETLRAVILKARAV